MSKGLVLQYSVSGYPDQETLKVCDEGRAGMQTLLVETAKVVTPLMTPLVWILTRRYKREVTDKYIRYTFPWII